MNEFKVGDIVYLKSGSPKLTIKSIKKSAKNSGLFPVLTAPEGIAIWNEKDIYATTIRKTQEELLRNITSGESLGVLLPFGWKLKLEPRPMEQPLEEEDIEVEVSWLSSTENTINETMFFAPQLSTNSKLELH